MNHEPGSSRVYFIGPWVANFRCYIYIYIHIIIIPFTEVSIHLFKLVGMLNSKEGYQIE